MAVRFPMPPMSGTGIRNPNSARLGTVCMMLAKPTTQRRHAAKRVSSIAAGIAMAAASSMAMATNCRCSRLSESSSDAKLDPIFGFPVEAREKGFYFLAASVNEFRRRLQEFQAALAQQALGIESLQGGTNLSYKLSQIREAMCSAHTFLDHDDCGLRSSQKAEQDGLLLLADVTFTICNGMPESEIEDLFEEAVYSPILQNRYGVSTLSPKFKGNGKWSARLANAFKHQGKPWSDQIKAKVKADVAELVENNPATALNGYKRSSFDALITALETKLNTIAASKL